jgi:hypothetical protein
MKSNKIIAQDVNNTESEYTLRASSAVYWGLGIMNLFFLGLAWFFDTALLEEIFFGIPSLIAIAGTVDIMFYQKRKTNFFSRQIEIIRGLAKRKELIAFENITKFELFGDNTAPLGELKKFDFEENKNIIKKLIIYTKDKDIEFNSYDYDDKKFREFLLFFQQKQIALTSTQTEKLQLSAQQCENLLKQERQLAVELTEAMQEAYKSVYETHIMYAQQEDKEFIREQMKNLDVIYHYSPDNKTYYYFVKNDYLQMTEAQNIEIANNLIETSLKNLALVENRIQAYKQVQAKLSKIVDQQMQRNQLKNVADKLNTLQQKNISKNISQDDIHFDAEVFEQYSNMLNQIQQTETAEQAEFLKQYIIEIENLNKQ